MEIDDLKNNPETIKQLIGLLSSLLDNDNSKKNDPEPDDQQSENKRNGIQNQTNVRGKGSRSNRPKHSNKFLTMSEKNMFKEDTAVDKLLAKYPPTERSRSSTKINVRCRICGRSETIHPSMLCESVERYKCNNCSTSPG
jgi:hypothetical protein